MATSNKRAPSAISSNSMSPNQQILDLISDIFDDPAHALVKPFTQWLATSKPFVAFAQSYQSKIRKKVKICRDVEESYNLYCELRTSFLLLQEAKFAVAYEPYGLRDGRSADFAVTFRTNTTFHVEVTRLRATQLEQLEQIEKLHNDSSRAQQLEFVRQTESRRLADVVCDKFSQLSAVTPNILWVWSDSRVMQEIDMGEVMLGLKRRVEQRDEKLYARYGYSKPADFTRYYQRMNVIIIQSLHEQSLHERDNALIWWQNKDSKHPLPVKVANLLRPLLAADLSPAFAIAPGKENNLD